MRRCFLEAPDYPCYDDLIPLTHRVRLQERPIQVASLSTREIDISIDETLGREAWPSLPAEEWLRRVVDCALRVALLPDEPGQVSLVVTDDATVRELNRKYRGLDEVTDVLSFSTIHPGHWEGEEDMPDTPTIQDECADGFMFPTGQAFPLGEIIVSYPQACRQAERRNEPVERELALLVIHGVLHLVGHDHLEVDDTALMQSKERSALAALFPVGRDKQ